MLGFHRIQMPLNFVDERSHVNQRNLLEPIAFQFAVGIEKDVQDWNCMRSKRDMFVHEPTEIVCFRSLTCAEKTERETIDEMDQRID